MCIKFIKSISISIVITLGLLGNTANAGLILDQVNDAGLGGGTKIGKYFRGSIELSQTFTAGISGSLAGLDLKGYTYDGVAEDLFIDLYEGSNRLATAVTNAEGFEFTSWNFIDFSSFEISLSEGSEYSFNLSTSHQNTNDSGYLFYFTGNDSYENGFMSANGSERVGNDLYFRTYIESIEVPEPSTLAILLLSVIGLASTKRIQQK